MRSAPPCQAARALVAGSLLAAACGGPGEPPPNLVLVVMDTMRADVFEMHDPERQVAPYVDRLAREGAAFPRAFSTSSWTAPATASLLTGVYPDRHGVQKGFLAQIRHAGGEDAATVAELELSRISDAVSTLPVLLKERGYTTFCVATNINIGEEIGFDQGFDRFVRKEVWSSRRVAELVESWHEDLAAAQPYFLYLHLNDPHKPWDRRKPWFEEGLGPEEKWNYLSEVGYLDHWLERTLEGLPGRDEALLALTTDHGEEFLDHGGFGHHLTLYDEVNRILLVLNGPGVEPGLRDLPVSGIDLLPTLLELTGEPAPADTVDGLSLAPVVRAGVAPAERAAREAELRDRALFAHRWGQGIDLYAAIRDDWKLIQGPERARLFDLASDPKERTNLWKEETERLEALRADLAEYLARDFEVDSATRGQDLSPRMLEMLQTLGYVEVEGEVPREEAGDDEP